MKCLILSFNHAEITKKCIESALDHFRPLDIFLVHNGSEKKNIEYLKLKFSNLNHIVIDKNIGFTGGINVGLRKLFELTNWVLFLSNDCQLISLPSSLNTSNLQLEIGLYGALVKYRNLKGIDSCGGLLDLTTVRLKHLKSLTEFHTQLKNTIKYIPGAAFILSKEVFNRLTGFDENFHTYWEDVDFSIRAQDENFKIDILNDFVVSHGSGKTTRKDSFYTFYLYNRNRKKLFNKFSNKFKCHSFFWLIEDVKLFFLILKTRRFQNLRYFFKIVSKNRSDIE